MKLSKVVPPVVAALLISLTFSLLVPLQAQATTATEAVALLNAQRAANGLPAGVTLDQSLLRAECDLEDHEIATFGTGGWTASTSPWNEAPLHKALLYSPFVTAASYGIYSHFWQGGEIEETTPAQCMWFSWDREAASRLSTPRFYSFVGSSGPSAVPLAERPDELPYSAQQAAGIQAEETGPSLILYSLGLGPEPRITAASLTTTSGQPVEVRTIDDGAPYEGQADLVSSAGILIPVKPLAGSTQYTASITWEGAEGRQATQTISFTTEAYCAAYVCPTSKSSTPSATALKHPRLRITGVKRVGRTLRISVAASPALIGHHVEITLKSPARCRAACGAHHANRLTISTVLRSRTLNLRGVASNASRVTLTSPAFTHRGVRYAATVSTASVRG
jgi:hypothetical protein